MTHLSFIIWSVDPSLFSIPDMSYAPRWYGLLFAMGFLVGQAIMTYIFKKEGQDVKLVDKLTMYVIIATIVGARLGHCLFYDPVYYLSNPLKLIAVWEGGLASHGGAIGLFISLYLFAKKYKYKYRWVLDRVAIITVLTGAFIRFGNFMNSEIIGKPTDSDNGVVFARVFEEHLMNAHPDVESITFEKGGDITSDKAGLVPMTVHFTFDKKSKLNDNTLPVFFKRVVPNVLDRQSVGEHITYNKNEQLSYKTGTRNGAAYAELYVLGIPRYPAQLFEAIACIFIFLIVAHIWYHHRDQVKDGFIFGVFMTLLWAERFGDEFFKEVQEPWEAALPINMGQILSIPMFIFGLVVLINAWGKREAK